MAVLLAVLLLLLGPPADAARWRPLGPDGGDVLSLAVDPHRGATLWAGTRGGGVFKTRRDQPPTLYAGTGGCRPVGARRTPRSSPSGG